MPRKITDEEYDALVKKYPDNELVKLELRMGDMVFRNPSESEFNVFQTQRLDEGQKKLCYPNLMTMCCVFPEAADLVAWKKRQPGLSSNVQVVRALQYLAGEADALAGKG